MTMDCDEFYFKDEMEKAKKYILENDISHSFVVTLNYVVKPIYRKLNPGYYVPFFSKINQYSSFTSSYFDKYYICLVDPTRPLDKYILFKFLFLKIYGKYHPFVLNNIAMHHMTSVRRDIMSKINNFSFQEAQHILIREFNSDLKEIESLKNGGGDCNIVIVKNYFDIKI